MDSYLFPHAMLLWADVDSGLGGFIFRVRSSWRLSKGLHSRAEAQSLAVSILFRASYQSSDFCAG